MSNANLKVALEILEFLFSSLDFIYMYLYQINKLYFAVQFSAVSIPWIPVVF